jgi:hypothetical protein
LSISSETFADCSAVASSRLSSSRVVLDLDRDRGRSAYRLGEPSPCAAVGGAFTLATASPPIGSTAGTVRSLDVQLLPVLPLPPPLLLLLFRPAPRPGGILGGVLDSAETPDSRPQSRGGVEERNPLSTGGSGADGATSGLSSAMIETVNLSPATVVASHASCVSTISGVNALSGGTFLIYRTLR